MKTRIIYTKIWEDRFFKKLSNPARFLFLYLITNPRINLCGIYEIQDDVILFETSLDKKQLSKIKKQLEPKVFFCEDWVYVVNAQRLGGYKGEKNNIACSRELKEIPENVKKTFDKLNTDRVSIPYTYTRDTSINHKPEIIDKKSKIISANFEKFYQLYDKKIDRHKAESKWKLLTDKEREKIIEILPDYVQANPDKKYRKNPTTFLNGRCWEDEIIKGRGIIDYDAMGLT